MSETDLEIVSVLEDARITAMCTQDDETLERLLSDDLVYTHSSGSVDTKETFLHSVRNGPVQYKTIERSEDSVRLVGDTALFSGRAAIHLEFGGHPVDLDLRYLAVWVQVDGTWRFEAWHSTPVSH